MKKLEDNQAYKNKLKYIKTFNKDQYKVFCIRFNKKYDADIIAFLESIPNKQGLIRSLLKAEMYSIKKGGIEPDEGRFSRADLDDDPGDSKE